MNWTCRRQDNKCHSARAGATAVIGEEANHRQEIEEMSLFSPILKNILGKDIQKSLEMLKKNLEEKKS